MPRESGCENQSTTRARADHSRTAIVLSILALLGLGACANVEKQTPGSPLEAAEIQLIRAEKQKSDVNAQAAEFLSAAGIAEEALNQSPENNSTHAKALSVYNRAAADLGSDLPALVGSQHNSKILVLKDNRTGQSEQLRLESGKRSEYAPDYFQHIIIADRINQKWLGNPAVRQGAGGKLVGVHHTSVDPTVRTRLEPLKGIRVTITAVVDVSRPGGRSASIRLLDPTKLDTVQIGNKTYSLAGDYTAALASYGRINENWIGLMNMIRGQNMRGAAGLLFLGPYDPAKLPVIFVHGLLSSPYAWVNTATDLIRDPIIRRRCQFWVFSYSTGNPIGYSALLLREDLAYAENVYHFKQAMLIGHSMGGLLSRLQVTNSGRVLWDGVFKSKANEIYNAQPADSVFKKALIVNANPVIKRVIFVSTPHRGSSLSTGFIGALGIKLIRLPMKVLNLVPETLVKTLAPNNDPRKFQPPTSISGLSPTNPMLIALNKLPVAVPCHSIMGDRGKNDSPYSTDSVVPYWSSHLDSAQSEVIVPTDHGAMASPKTTEEIRRIILEQLGMIQSKGPRTKVPQYGLSLIPPVYKGAYLSNP